IDCQDPDCTPLAVSAEVEGGGCAESTSGNVNLIVSGVAPFAYEWTDMEYTARWTFEENTNDVSDFGNHQNGGLGQIIYDRIAVQGNSSAYFNGATYLRYSVDAGGFMEKDFSKVSF